MDQLTNQEICSLKKLSMALLKDPVIWLIEDKSTRPTFAHLTESDTFQQILDDVERCHDKGSKMAIP